MNRREKERLQTEVDKLTGDVEKSLALTDDPANRENEATDPKPSVEQVEVEQVLQIPGSKHEENSSLVERESSQGSKAQ